MNERQPATKPAGEALTDEQLDTLMALFWRVEREHQGFYPATVDRARRIALRTVIDTAARLASTPAAPAETDKETK